MKSPLLAGDYASRLTLEIEKIDRQIHELTQDKATLLKQLAQAKREEHSLKGVSRKNSGVRVLIEARIIEALEIAKRPLGQKILFEEARIANHRLNPNTFRTYIKRLKEKGEIVGGPRRGEWALPVNTIDGNKKSPPPLPDNQNGLW